MDKRTFRAIVPIEIDIDGHAASTDLQAVIDYTMTKVVPAVVYGPLEHCHPAYGGEIEVLRVVALYEEVPVRGAKHEIVAHRQELRECPAWLASLIINGVGKDRLAEEADWSTDD